MLDKYGIIDVGSNTIRLVIYRHEKAGRFKEIENIKTVARLRYYLDEELNLNEEGIKLLIGTLKNFEEITQYHGVAKIKVVATATIRNAQNQDEIIENIRTHTKLNVRILSEYEEAYYGFLAIINSTSITEGITIDIGGGSTEVTYYKDRELINYHSFPFGALSLKKQFINGNVPTADELLQLTSFIHSEMNKLEWIKDRKVPIIAIGGSARNIAEIDQRRKMYPLGGLHQYEMNGNDLSFVKDMITPLKFEQLKKIEGLSEDRADSIIPALEVFNVIYRISNATAFILSRKGLRDGVFFEELLRPLGINMFPNVLEESFFELENEYEININNVIKASQIAVKILHLLRKNGFNWIQKQHFIEIKRAAYLFQLGKYIDAESSSQHTFYLLVNRTIDGLMHGDRLRLATIASYKSKVNLKQYLNSFEQWISKDDIKMIRILGAVLRFAYALNETKRDIVKQIEITEQEGQLLFTVLCSKNWQAEKFQAEKEKKQLEKALKRIIKLQFSKN